MGQRLSRSYYTPLKDVTVRQLAGSSPAGSNFLLSPAFCLKVLKRGLPPHYECSKKELTRFSGVIKYEESEVWREKQKKVEDRLWVSMTRRKPTRQLESEVEAVLEHLYASRSWFRRPGLLERTLVDQLENVLAAGKQNTLWNRMLYMWRRLFRKSVSTKTLRSSTKYSIAAATPGTERAHVLSLAVAVRLWREFRGDDTIARAELPALRRMLNDSRNLSIVCQHTNRVLHVRYDEEILKRLDSSSSSSLRLSPGAAKRLSAASSVLQKLSREHEEMKPFCDSALRRLNSL